MTRQLVVLLLATGLCGIVSAQTNTLSPYSIYGLGDAAASNITAQAAMGHAGIAVINPSNINSLNPATFPDISRPSFNIDFRNETLTLSNQAASQTNNIFSIQNFSFAFPLINEPKKKRKAALSFGLTPYTRQGYQLGWSEEVAGLGNVEYQFSGDGGLNSLYLCAGYELLADSGRVNVLSIGAMGSYVFGKLSRNRITYFGSDVDVSNLYRQFTLEVSDADFNFALLYKRKITWKNRKNEEQTAHLSAGAFYKPAVQLNSFVTNHEFTFAGHYLDPDTIDTVTRGQSRVETAAPASMGVGLSANFNGRWTFALDAVRTEWSSLSIGGVSENLKDATRISFGTEYIPDFTAYKEFFKTLRYRAGLTYEQTMFNVSGSQPLRYGVTAGFGIPLFASQSTSMLNFGIEYARRESTATPLSESFFNIHAGFTLTPNKFDRWFYKRKYD